MVIPVRRRRWRAALVILHGLLIMYSFVVFIMLLIPVIYHTTSTDYYIVLLLVIMIFFYSIFGFLVFWIFKYLLRVLCLVAAITLFVISLFFVVSYFLSVSCSFEYTKPMNLTLSSDVCKKVRRSGDHVIFNCKRKIDCGRRCLPLSTFWSTISETRHLHISFFLMPMVFFFASCVLLVLILTIWRGVDEIRFQKDICLFGVYPTHLYEHGTTVMPVVYSASKAPTTATASPKFQMHGSQKPKEIEIDKLFKSATDEKLRKSPSNNSIKANNNLHTKKT